jgi:hypothetical protein
MDSLTIYPEDVWTEVFSYLGTRDLLRASLVSKDWYRMIARSPRCMKKFNLGKSYNMDYYESLLYSSRLYQNLSLMCLYDDSNIGEYPKVANAILEKFSNSLTSIKISHDVEVQSDFPNLKSLNFYFYKSSIVPNGLLTKAKHLTYLNVNGFNLDATSEICLRNFFMETSSLKVLKMRDCRPMIDTDLKDSKLRIEEFYFSQYWDLEHSFRNLLNISNFFMAQSSSLKIVECAFSHDIVQFFMSNFPNLHTLIVKTRDSNIIGYPEHEYPINMSIKNLIFDVGEDDHMITILLKLHSLEALKVRRINQEVLNAIICCKSLKVVKYRVLEEDVRKADLKRVHNIRFIQEGLLPHFAFYF